MRTEAEVINMIEEYRQSAQKDKSLVAKVIYGLAINILNWVLGEDA